MTKSLATALCVWSINLIIFTVSLFLFSYYESINSWLEDPWYIIFNVSLITKVVLSIVVVSMWCSTTNQTKE